MSLVRRLVILIIATLCAGCQPASTRSDQGGSLTMIIRPDFACQLPAGINGHQVMIALPSGRVTAGPSSDRGIGTYAGGRWLHVFPMALAPDRGAYAFVVTTEGVPQAQRTGDLRVHTIASGKEQQIWTGDGDVRPLAWTENGIYLERDGSVWLVDPAAPAKAHRVGPNPVDNVRHSTGVFGWFGQSAAWVVSGSDRAVVGANRPEFADQVDRLNLADGTLTTWFRAPAERWARILGLDADGHPFLGLEEPPATVGDIAYPHEPDELLLLLTSPGQTMTIAGAGAGLRPRAANTDSHGTWITASGSLWLYRNGTVSRVANVPDSLYPALRRPVPSFPPGFAHGRAGTDLILSGPCT